MGSQSSHRLALRHSGTFFAHPCAAPPHPTPAPGCERGSLSKKGWGHVLQIFRDVS